MNAEDPDGFFSRAMRCYLCWAVAGVLLGAVSAGMEPGVLKVSVKIVAAIVLLAGGIFMAFDQDRIRREKKKKHEGTDHQGR